LTVAILSFVYIIQTLRNGKPKVYTESLFLTSRPTKV